MPPRRSSRSTRASVEPSEAPVPTTKRKRGQTVEPEQEQQEKVPKPSSRARRSTSAQPAAASEKTRTSTRSRGSLPDVPETDDEEDADSAPPVKKPRPSLEPQEEKDSDFEEEKPKARRTASLAKRGRGAAGRKPSSSTHPGRSSRGATVSVVEEEQENEQEEEEKPVISNHSNLSSTRSQIDDDDAMVTSEDEPQPKPQKSAKKSSKGPKSRKTASRQVASDDEPTEQVVDRVKEEPLQQTTEEKPEASALMEEEEETSLFDPPHMPPPSSQPQTMPEEPSGPKPRLVIHMIVLVNFKSYAGRQEIGPFHKSFSAIVGPNGSGKSNTIDALLFVFGYRASKMRQGKLSELIHNSARYPNLDECSVEVHFREIIDLPGPDDFEVVPKSQLIVTRQAFKNNSSRYAINGKSSTYTEVQTLLKGRGIDLDHNRFLILQGEVESIAQMKPKAASEHDDGLLEYLEDIIGTSRFKQPIDESLVDMERLQDERMMKLNRLRIVEKEKAGLEAQKKEAEDYLRLKNELIRARSRLWQWFLWLCLKNEEEYKKKIARLSEDLEEETNRHQADIDHIEELKTHYKDREATYAEVEAAVAVAAKDLATREKDEVGLQERKKHAATKAKKLKKLLQDDTSLKAKAARDVEDNSEKIVREKKKLEDYEAKLVEEEKVLEGIRDSLKDKTQVFHDQIEVKQKELQPWTTKINTKQAEIDVASSELDALVKKAEALEAARKEAQETLEGLKGDHVVKVGVCWNDRTHPLTPSSCRQVEQYDKLKDSKANLQRDIQSAESKVQDAQRNADEWKKKAGASRQKVDEAKASQAENRSRNIVLDSLNRLKEAGRVSGFHGRLGSLGTIPDEYDVAISTAAPALHHMVVDRVEQGQEYMEQANRIAYGAKRWKVVTLTGQVIETSGTMSGGGGQPARGAMSSKLAADGVSPQVLRKYEQDSQDTAQRLENALVELREAEEALSRLSNSGPQIDMAFQKLGLDIENSKRRIAEAEKRVQDVNARSGPNKVEINRIKDLEGKIGSSEEQLEELLEKSARIQDAIKELEQKILDIGGSRLLKQKSTVEGIKLHINLANEEITKAEVSKAKAEKDLTRHSAAIENNTASFEEAETELGTLNAELDELTTYVEELRAKVETAQEAANNSKEVLDKLKAEVDEKEEEISVFKKKEMDIQQKIGDLETEMRANDGSIEYYTTEHDKLQLEHVDDGDDDDDDEEEEENHDTVQVTEQPEGETGAEDVVKPDPEGPPLKKSKGKSKPSSQELYVYRPEELSRLKKRELVADEQLLDERVKNAKPNLDVLKEYRKREEEFLERAKDLDAVTAERDAQKQKYDGLRKQRLEEFMSGFNLISIKLKEMYQMITLGGNAELELVDSMDPFSEGIIFSVMPPKKSWKNISNLGFSTLPITSNDMFELSHRLIGIYKTANATRSVSIDNQPLSAPPVKLKA
ncbi:hypothetical protein H0H93_012338 [Arthromyces matolae]|nr:hypothetical protein H0H93_012338 [Arthromyces matolae]